MSNRLTLRCRATFSFYFSYTGLVDSADLQEEHTLEPHLPPTVLIDGAAIRRIRETKKLTQLYVAKVVGVTTDTISRWENNRYPSIKRDNVLRLAEALEVDVEKLLLSEEGEEESSESAAPANRSRLLPLFLLCLVILGVMFIYFQRKPARMEVLAERMLPRYAAPGTVIPVWVKIEPSLRQKGYILREHFPHGWKLIESSPPASSLDNVEGIARWIVKPGETREKIVYLLKVGRAKALGESQLFKGEVVIKGGTQDAPAQVGGNLKMEIAGYLWPDSNGDRIIDDGEMLAASDVFDEMNGVHLDWNFLEKVWDAGHYSWNQKKNWFVPVKAKGGVAQAPSVNTEADSNKKAD